MDESATQEGRLPVVRIALPPSDGVVIELCPYRPGILLVSTGNPSMDGIAQGPAPAEAEADVLVHLRDRGDVLGKFGDWLGEQETFGVIEGFAVAAPDGVRPDELVYQAVFDDKRISPWVKAGQFCGSRCRYEPVIGLRLKLTGKAAAMYSVTLSVRDYDGNVTGPVGNDQFCVSVYFLPLEALQIVMTPKPTKTI